jgi:hypothetical protein
MSAEQHQGHDKLEKIVKLTDRVQNVPQSEGLKNFRDEAYILTSDTFKHNRRKQLSGKAVEKTAEAIAAPLIKLVLKYELGIGGQQYKNLRAAGTYKDARTGESGNFLDREVMRLAGFSKDGILKTISGKEISPDLMEALETSLYQAYVQIAQAREVQGAIRTNEDAALALKYLAAVQKEVNAPKELKEMKIPDFSKSGLSLQEAVEMYMKGLGAMGSYRPQVGKLSQAHAH